MLTSPRSRLRSCLIRSRRPAAFSNSSAVAAVRQVTEARTEAQRAIANYWNQGAGTPSTPGYWLAEASDLIVDAGLRPAELASARQSWAWSSLPLDFSPIDWGSVWSTLR